MLSVFFSHLDIMHTNLMQILNIIINPCHITPYPNSIYACTRYNAKLMRGDVASGLQMVSLATMKILTDYVPRQEIQKLMIFRINEIWRKQKRYVIIWISRQIIIYLEVVND